MRSRGRRDHASVNKATSEGKFVIHNLTFKRKSLRGSAALRALALMGAGAAASVTVAAPAAAQDYTNVIASGRVQGTNGQPISGATVVVRSNAQGFERTVTTDGNGSFRVPALPQGTYTFTITAPGFDALTDGNVVLTQSQAANQFTLSAAGEASAGGDIVVTAGRVAVADFDRTTTGAVISIGELAGRVPVARDLASVILLAPGTSAGDTAFGNLAAVSGSSVSENVYFLNGLNITDFRQGLGAVNVPFEFYNTIEVKNGGAPAEFGRFTGGFVNATTKSGGNEFHGGLLFNYQPNSMRSDVPNTLVDYNEQDTLEQKQAIFNLSGPIIKDHLFFYAFYQTNDNQRADTLLTVNPNTVLLGPRTVGGVAVLGDINPVTGQRVTQNTTVAPYSTGLRRDFRRFRSPFYGGKLDAVITDGQRLEFTYFNSKGEETINSFNVTDLNGGGYDSRLDSGIRTGTAQGSTVFRSGGENYIGRYTGQFTNWLTVSAAYGKNKNRQIDGSNDDTYPFIADTSGRFSPALSGNSLNAISVSNDTREFYRGDIDLFFSVLGRHHIKAGFDQEKLTTESSTRYTGNVAYTYTNSGATGDVYVATPNTLYVTGRTFVNGGVFQSKNTAAYIQDSWSLFNDRLTLNLGLRYDRFTNDNVNGLKYYDSGDTFAPRLAFAGDPFGDGKTKLYGSFSRYYLPVVANTNIRLAGAELDYTRYNLVTGVNANNTPILGAPVLGFADAQACPDTGIRNCDITSDGVATPTESTVSKNLTPQSVDEYILGIERNLGSRIRVGVFGQYRKLNDSLEDVAIDAAVIKYCQANRIALTNAAGTGCADIFTGFHQYVLVNPGKPQTITISEILPGQTARQTVDFSAADLGYPAARRTYKAVTATFDRDFDGTWSLSGSYTWSRSRGNIEGGIRSDNGQTDSGLTTAFDQPGLTNGTYGPLPGDATHKFKLFGSYALTEWLTLGLQGQAISPRKFGCIGRVPVSVDPFAGAYGAAGYYCNVDAGGAVITDPNFTGFQNNAAGTSLKLTPRGSVLKSDWNTFINASAVVRVPTDAFDASFRVDVFNVFNQQGVLDVRELGTQQNGRPRGDYGSPLSYQAPRFVRFQLQFGF